MIVHDEFAGQARDLALFAHMAPIWSVLTEAATAGAAINELRIDLARPAGKGPGIRMNPRDVHVRPQARGRRRLRRKGSGTTLRALVSDSRATEGRRSSPMGSVEFVGILAPLRIRAPKHGCSGLRCGSVLDVHLGLHAGRCCGHGSERRFSKSNDETGRVR